MTDAGEGYPVVHRISKEERRRGLKALRADTLGKLKKAISSTRITLNLGLKSEISNIMVDLRLMLNVLFFCKRNVNVIVLGINASDITVELGEDKEKEILGNIPLDAYGQVTTDPVECVGPEGVLKAEVLNAQVAHAATKGEEVFVTYYTLKKHQGTEGNGSLESYAVYIGTCLRNIPSMAEGSFAKQVGLHRVLGTPVGLTIVVGLTYIRVKSSAYYTEAVLGVIQTGCVILRSLASEAYKLVKNDKSSCYKDADEVRVLRCPDDLFSLNNGRLTTSFLDSLPTATGENVQKAILMVRFVPKNSTYEMSFIVVSVVRRCDDSKWIRQKIPGLSLYKGDDDNCLFIVRGLLTPASWQGDHIQIVVAVIPYTALPTSGRGRFEAPSTANGKPVSPSAMKMDVLSCQNLNLPVTGDYSKDGI
ncbi:hypothetical protein Tco_0674147, partial [Tanacetum coccineum]